MNGTLFVSSRKPNFPGAMDVARDKDGCCVFFEQDDGGSCVIHREAGIQALPSACRHFPRHFLRDGRGTLVSLSHFCPTAASMLDHAEPLAVVEAAPPLLLEEPIEGLDGRDALPPLLRPGLLCDLAGYDAWERASVAVLGRSDLTWRQALDRIAAATERVRTWEPGVVSLTSHVAAAFEDRMSDATPPSFREQELLNVLRRLTKGRMPRADGIADFDARWREGVGNAFDCHDRAMKNYIAARIFGNWIAYQGRGLRSIVQWARAAAALVRHHALRRVLDSRRPPTQDAFIEAVRRADLVLLHGIHTQAFARAVAPLEGPA